MASQHVPCVEVFPLVPGVCCKCVPRPVIAGGKAVVLGAVVAKVVRQLTPDDLGAEASRNQQQHLKARRSSKSN